MNEENERGKKDRGGGNCGTEIWEQKQFVLMTSRGMEVFRREGSRVFDETVQHDFGP